MTHAELVARAVRWTRTGRKCPVVFAEIVTAAPVTPDVIGFHARGVSITVECKTSRSDFRRDRHKVSARSGRVPGDLRWYFTPPGLLTPADLPEGYGLAECHARIVRVVRDASPIERTEHQRRVDMMILVSACRRHQLGIPWRASEARFAPYALDVKREEAEAGRPT